MADLPDLNVKITADTGSLDAALSKASRAAKGLEGSFDGASGAAGDLGAKSDQAGGRLSSFGDAAGKAKVGVAALGVAAIAAGTALISATKAAAEASKEIAILSNQAGVSAEEFQKLAFAANKVGVEQDKLGDIFKDAREKIGDFTATGGGELTDFFEKVAPLAGVTAEEFKHLSGPQVLEKFQKALDAANVSANEQVTFLEALASDASLLQPLLTNNAAALKEYTKQAEDFNLVLSNFDVSQLREAQSAFDDIGTVMRVRTNQAVAELAPLVRAVADEFMASTNVSGNFGNVAINAVRTVSLGVAAVIDGVRLLEAGFKGLVVITAVTGSAIANGMVSIAESVDNTIVAIKQQINDLVQFANSTGFFNIELLDTQASAIVGKTRELAIAMQASLEQAQASLGDTLAGPTAIEKVEAFFDKVQTLSEEARAAFAEQGGSPLGAAMGLPSGDGSGLTTGGEDKDPLELLRQQQEARLAILQEFAGLEEEAAIAKFERDQERIMLAAENELISEEEKNAAIQALQEQHIGAMANLYNKDSKAFEAAEKFKQKMNSDTANRRVKMEQQVTSILSNLLTRLLGDSKAAQLAMIAIDVARGVAQNQIATTVAAMRAMSDLGPIAGPPVAASITAAGAANQGLIIASGALGAAAALTQPSGSGGGGGGISASSGSGGANSGSTGAQQASPAQASERSIVSINLEGEVFGREQIRSLIGNINEAIDDGARLRIS